MRDKHYLANYYGIDETLPDDEFYQKIREINRECEEKIKNYSGGKCYERKTKQTADGKKYRYNSPNFGVLRALHCR